MEKVCIKPVDDSIKTRVEALNLLNEFKILGFGRSGFIGVVQNNIEAYKTWDGAKQLMAFWDGRNHKEDLIEDLQQLVEQLKLE